MVMRGSGTALGLRGCRLGGAGRPRLDDVDADLAAGITAVVGPSGAGKSSLLAVLAGFERPDTGALAGEPPPGDGPRCYWMPPGLGLWPHLDVDEHLRTVCRDPDRREEILAACSLAGLRDRRPPRCSQGERARLALARAWCAGPRLLLLDEPLAHLEPALADAIWAALVDECRRVGRQLVYATHLAEHVHGVADEVLVLEEGRLRQHGSVEEVYRRPVDETVARLLGPCNWFADDAWLVPAPEHPCVRPERLALQEADDGPCEILAHRTAAGIGRSRLRGPGGEREFCHRPPPQPFAVGARVRIGLLGLLCAWVLALGGCGGGGELDFAAVEDHYLPPAGGVLPAPRALHAAGERLFSLDTAGRVLIHDPHGEQLETWHMPESEVGNPEGLCLLADGRLVVADTHYHRLVFFGPAGEVVATVGGERGSDPGSFIYPIAVCDDDRGRIYVGEYGGNDRIQVFDADGELLYGFGAHGTGPGEFQRPGGLAWRAGLLYVTDAFNNRIQVFAEDGELRRIIGEGLHLDYPYGCTFDSRGRLWVVEYGAGRLTCLDPDGSLLGRYRGPADGGFRTPWGLEVAGDGTVWVADTGHRRMVALRP